MMCTRHVSLVTRSPSLAQEEDWLRPIESERVLHDKCADMIRCIVMYLMYCAQLAHSLFDLLHALY
jgi:hypothetical protein